MLPRCANRGAHRNKADLGGRLTPAQGRAALLSWSHPFPGALPAAYGDGCTLNSVSLLLSVKLQERSLAPAPRRDSSQFVDEAPPTSQEGSSPWRVGVGDLHPPGVSLGLALGVRGRRGVQVGRWGPELQGGPRATLAWLGFSLFSLKIELSPQDDQLSCLALNHRGSWDAGRCSG